MTTMTPPQASQSPAPETGGAGSGPYRKDQGRLARMAAFWGLLLLLLFGCDFLHGFLSGWENLRTPIGGITVPFLGIALSPAFVIGLILFVVGAYAIHRWQGTPKVADLLIETESELRKTTWPTMDEVINSSIVVVVTVLVLGAFLALADSVLARVMAYFILGQGFGS